MKKKKRINSSKIDSLTRQFWRRRRLTQHAFVRCTYITTLALNNWHGKQCRNLFLSDARQNELCFLREFLTANRFKMPTKDKRFRSNQIKTLCTLRLCFRCSCQPFSLNAINCIAPLLRSCDGIHKIGSISAYIRLCDIRRDRSP